MKIAKVFSNEMCQDITQHLWDVSLWYEIFSHLDNEHDLLRVATVNNQFRSLLALNYFWIKYVNDNYKYSKTNIYESILESINIIHRLTVFLYDSNNVSMKCILSDKKLLIIHFIKCILMNILRKMYF